MKIRKLSILFATVFVLFGYFFYTGDVQASETVATGWAGEAITWVLDDEGTITFSGTGEMNKYRNNNQEYYAYRLNIKKVVFSEGITKVGENAFYNFVNIEEVQFADSIEAIDTSAFGGCVNLGKIDLPANLIRLGTMSFASCTSITEVVLPGTIHNYGGATFYCCTNLTKVYFEANPRNEGITFSTGIFMDCTKLENIEVDEKHRYLCDIDGVLYARAYAGGAELIQYPCGRKGKTYTLPKNCVEIYADAVVGAIELEGLVIQSDCLDKVFRGNLQSLNYITYIGENSLNLSVFDDSLIEDFLDENHQFHEKIEKGQTVHKFTVADAERVDSTCEEAGREACTYCDACGMILAGGDVIPPKGHMWKKTAHRDATDYENGYNKYKCDNCGTTREEILPSKKIVEFVERLYSILLGRRADGEGIGFWSNMLATGQYTCAELVRDIVTSDEFRGFDLPYAETVERMYKAMLGRPSDEGGKAEWVARLNDGMSVKSIVNGFSGSDEFREICAKYGMEPGSILLDEPRDYNRMLTAFVSRCYTKTLQRAYDVDGLNFWCAILINKEMTPYEVAHAFVFSDEFIGKNLGNEEFVRVLYGLCFDREGDAEGINFWLGWLNDGHSREEVFNGFAYSDEFAKIIAGFGL